MLQVSLTNIQQTASSTPLIPQQPIPHEIIAVFSQHRHPKSGQVFMT